MLEGTLFGHLALTFSTQPENLATEALIYVIGRSRPAKLALLRYLDRTGSERDGELSFVTQVTGDDKARPDLVGFDGKGRPVMIIEAKFWAGLTANQPVTYLRRLPGDTTGIVLFIAPEQRIGTLWPELIRRCRDAGMSPVKIPGADEEFLSARIDEGRCVGLISWRSLLRVMHAEAEEEGQTAVVSDIAQLHGLCERMDAEAFLPLQSEELTGQLATRVLQYCQLVDDVTRILVEEKTASIEGLRAAAAAGSYVRYMRIRGCGCVLQFNARYWRQLALTPIWLGVSGEDFRLSPHVRDALQGLELEDPRRSFILDGYVNVPLYVPTGVDREQVVEALAAQAREVAALLKAGLGTEADVDESRAQPGQRESES